MLPRGPSLRPFAHGAAFLLVEASVSGQSLFSLQLHQWAFLHHFIDYHQVPAN
jgi:hypothetical protein